VIEASRENMPPPIEEVRKAISEIAEAWSNIGQIDPRAA